MPKWRMPMILIQRRRRRRLMGLPLLYKQSQRPSPPSSTLSPTRPRSLSTTGIDKMLTAQTKRRLFWLAEVMLFAAAIGMAVHTSQAREWSSLPLAGLLLALTLIGMRLGVTLRSQQVTADFLALVLTMSLLGPVPAVCFGIFAIAISSAVRRISLAGWLSNLTNFAVFPLVGGLMIGAVIGDVHDPRNQHLTQSITFGLVVFGVFMVTIVLNFALVAAHVHVTQERSLTDQVREVLIPLMPGQIATGAL